MKPLGAGLTAQLPVFEKKVALKGAVISLCKNQRHAYKACLSFLHVFIDVLPLVPFDSGKANGGRILVYRQGNGRSVVWK